MCKTESLKDAATAVATSWLCTFTLFCGTESDSSINQDKEGSAEVRKGKEKKVKVPF